MELHNSETAQTQILEAEINQQIMESFQGGQKQMSWDMAHLLTQPCGSILNLLLTLKQQWVAS